MNSSEMVTKEIVGQKSIFSNYAILVSQTFLTAGISVISSVFMYRILSVKSIGIAAIYISVLNSLIGLFLMWPVAGFLQYGREEYDRTKRLERTFGSTFLMIGTLLIISATFCILLREPLMHYIGLPLIWIGLLILDIFFKTLNGILNQIFYITSRIKKLFILNLLSPCFMLIFVCYVWVTMGSIEVTTYLLVSASLSAVTFFFYLFFSREYIFPFHFSFSEAKRILRFSGFLYGAAIFSFIYEQFDFLVINHYRPAEQLAYYSLAYRLYTFITMLPMLSTNLIYPIMISYRNLGHQDLFQKYSSRTIPQLFFFWTIGCIAILLVMPLAIPLLFGAAYRLSIPCFSIFCLSAILQFTIAFHSPIITSHERVDWSMKVNLIGTIIIAIGNLLLIPPMGIFGASLATLISYGFNSIAYAYLTKRIVGGNYKGYEIIMVLFSVPVATVTIIEIPFALRMLTFAVVLMGMLWWSYRHRLFDKADLFFLEGLSLPRRIQRLVYITFAWLEPRNKVVRGFET
jgi:O-antigen/teichoic acid export membrane protein